MSRRKRRKQHRPSVPQTLAQPPALKEPEPVVEAPVNAELTVIPRTAWDPAMLLMAKHHADQGNLELVGDIWESMLADDRVAAAIEQRLEGLEGLPLAFEGGDPGLAEHLDEDFWSMSTPGTRKAIRRWGLGAGVVAVQARRWEESPSGRMVPVLKVWHPRWLRWRQHEERWYIQTMQGEVDLLAEPGRWWLFAPGADPDARPWVTGLWYSTATWWLSKTYSISDLASFCQSHATPKWILEGLEGVNVKPAVKREALKWLSQVIARSGIYVPPGFKLRQEETNSYAWQAYTEGVKLANRSLASRILGQHLTTDEAGGAGAVMDDKLRQDLLEADADDEAAFWHEGPLATWASINYQADAEPPWPRRDVTPPSDRKANSEAQVNASTALKVLGEAGALGEVDIRQFLGEYFPLVGEEERTATPDHPATFLRALSSREITDFPSQGDDLKVSLRNSQYALFDAEYADRLKEDWPQIWDAGGNDAPGTEHSGDDQWRRLRPQVGRAPETDTEEEAVRRREAWAARHAGNTRLAGVVALVKWLVVGDIGEARMKRVIEEEKERLRKRGLSSLQLSALGPDRRRHAVEARVYADEISEELAEKAAPEVEAMGAEVMRALSTAGSYAEARKRLAALFPSMDVAGLRSVMAGALLLSQAAGRASVGLEDT